MKALELVVYAKEPGRYGGEPRYHSPDGLWAYPASHVDGYAAEKRLTDAELAAEYYAALAHFERMGFNEVSSGDDWDDATWVRIAKPMQTLHRFATLPHYDEPTQTGNKR